MADKQPEKHWEDWKKRAEAAEKLLKSILSDFDAMTSCEELEGETLLGGFSNGMWDSDSDEHFIAWPNMEYMMGKVREHFEDHEHA